VTLSPPPNHTQISTFFESLATPARIQILQAIGSGEACVCHLEHCLGLRQAYISQQLMSLRENEIITSRRSGKYIYYRVARPEVLQLLQIASQAVGITPGFSEPDPDLRIELRSTCECPKCKN